MFSGTPKIFNLALFREVIIPRPSALDKSLFALDLNRQNGYNSNNERYSQIYSAPITGTFDLEPADSCAPDLRNKEVTHLWNREKHST